MELHHFTETAVKVDVLLGEKERRMDQDLRRWIEGAYQVLECLIVEGRLGADAAIRLGEQRGGNENPVYAPVEGRGGKT